MNDLLKTQFENAVRHAQASHASNIVQDCLPAFVRMARVDSTALKPTVENLTRLTTFGYGNAVPSLYCLLKLADVSDEMKVLVRESMGDELITFLAEDEDANVKGNAEILIQVLGGAPLANFEGKDESGRAATVYNLQNSNLAINSPNSQQQLKIENMDDESRQLILALLEAVEKKDKPAIMKALSYIADKSVDLLVSVIAAKALAGP